jgi:DNA-binding XRE family transcriptional regulator
MPRRGGIYNLAVTSEESSTLARVESVVERVDAFCESFETLIERIELLVEARNERGVLANLLDRAADSVGYFLRIKLRGAHALHVAFGLAVREVRAERAISQEELGYRAGLHRNYVSRIERGKVVPTLRTVEALADALMTAPSALIAESERYAARR